MGKTKASGVPSPPKRYTLHYCHLIETGDIWYKDYIPRWERIDFKTLGEAREYLTIAGENAYIIDNVTKKRIEL